MSQEQQKTETGDELLYIRLARGAHGRPDVFKIGRSTTDNINSRRGGYRSNDMAGKEICTIILRDLDLHDKWLVKEKLERAIHTAVSEKGFYKKYDHDRSKMFLDDNRNTFLHYVT